MCRRATVSPFPASVSEFAAALAELGLDRHRDALTGLARESIRLLLRTASERRISPGGSKVGGSPDLPAGVRWPQCPDGVPLSFLAQFNLGELPITDADGLPNEGLLSFFYDSVHNPSGDRVEDLGCCRVLYSPRSPWGRRAQPEVDGEPVCDEFVVGRPRFERYLSVPLFPDVLDDPDEADRYREAYASDEPVSKLLGNPDVLQNAMESCCQLLVRGISCVDAAPPPEPERAEAQRAWRLLLQLDCEPVPGMLWGRGSGRLYFWIRRRDLAARDFGAVLAIVQDI
jgi:uncharacterized protein YwqG